MDFKQILNNKPLLFGIIGFCITTFKMPNSSNFEILRKTGGENIDDIRNPNFCRSTYFDSYS